MIPTILPRPKLSITPQSLLQELPALFDLDIANDVELFVYARWFYYDGAPDCAAIKTSYNFAAQHLFVAIHELLGKEP